MSKCYRAEDLDEECTCGGIYLEAAELHEALKGVAKWCHGGHGDYPAKNCGLCKPVLAVLAKAEGKP